MIWLFLCILLVLSVLAVWLFLAKLGGGEPRGGGCASAPKVTPLLSLVDLTDYHGRDMYQAQRS